MVVKLSRYRGEEIFTLLAPYESVVEFLCAPYFAPLAEGIVNPSA